MNGVSNGATCATPEYIRECVTIEADVDPPIAALLAEQIAHADNVARRRANREQREAIARHVAELTRLLESYAQVRDEARMAWALDEIQKQVATYRGLL